MKSAQLGSAHGSMTVQVTKARFIAIRYSSGGRERPPTIKEYAPDELELTVDVQPDEWIKALEMVEKTWWDDQRSAVPPTLWLQVAEPMKNSETMTHTFACVIRPPKQSWTRDNVAEHQAIAVIRIDNEDRYRILARVFAEEAA